MSRLLLDHILWLLYGVLLMVVFGVFVVKPAGREGDFCAQNQWLCDLKDIAELGIEQFRFLIPFLLSGLISYVVSKWALRRTNYAALCGMCRNLLVQIGSFLPMPIGAEAAERRELRMKLGRWVLLAFELAVLKARGNMDSEGGREFLLREGLITEDEWDCMIDGDRHSTVFWWIQSQLTVYAGEGVITPLQLSTCATAITGMRAQANDLMSSLDRDVPYPYISLSGFLVKMNVFFFTTARGLVWAVKLGSGGFVNRPVFWFDLLIVFAWNIAYDAVYYMASHLYNPFGSRKIDVAHEAIGAGLRKLGMELMKGTEHLPRTYDQSSGLKTVKKA